MVMIKKISRKKAIQEIPFKTIVDGQRVACRFCGEEICNENIINGVVICPNPECPLQRKIDEQQTYDLHK